MSIINLIRVEKSLYSDKVSTFCAHFIIITVFLIVVFFLFSTGVNLGDYTDNAVQNYILETDYPLAIYVGSNGDIKYKDLVEIRKSLSGLDYTEKISFYNLYKDITVFGYGFRIKFDIINNSTKINIVQGIPWSTEMINKNNIWINEKMYDQICYYNDGFSIGDEISVYINNIEYFFIVKGLVEDKEEIYIDSDYAISSGLVSDYSPEFIISEHNCINGIELLNSINVCINEYNSKTDSTSVRIQGNLKINKCNEMINTSKIIQIIIFVLGCIVLFLVSRIILDFVLIGISENINKIALYKCLGIKNRDIVNIFSIPYMCLLLISEVISVLSVFMLNRYTIFIIQNIMQYYNALGFVSYFPLSLLTLTCIILLFFIYIIMYLIISHKLSNRNILKALKEEL